MKKVVLFVLLSITIFMYGCTSKESGEKEETINSQEVSYASMIPDPNVIFKNGEINVTDKDDGDYYMFNVTNYTVDEYDQFVSGCKEKGFNDISYDTEHDRGKDFGAYSSDGKYWVQVNLDTSDNIIYVICQKSKHYGEE